MNNIFLSPQSVLFSFTADLITDIKENGFKPWDIANEIYEAHQEVKSKPLEPVVMDSVKTITLSDEGDKIVALEFLYDGLEMAKINPAIGLTLGK